VELGLSDDTNQEVTKGLAAGQTIAVGPGRLLRELHDGDVVSAKKAEADLDIKGNKVAGAGR
jgi:HlyD family secretion protein